MTQIPITPGATLIGPTTRENNLQVDELAAMHDFARLKPSDSRVMVDVGAHRGGTQVPFLQDGWKVYAFEPDQTNRNHLIDRHHRFIESGQLVVDPRAVAEKTSESVPFFTSSESSGVSSMMKFLDSHQSSGTVPVTCLADFFKAHQIGAVGILKIDTEGFDHFVLKGIPWDSVCPELIMVEFEDAKTQALGYSAADMQAYLIEMGYRVFVSDWHPILRYGVEHSWLSLRTGPVENFPEAGWGNLIAIREPADAETFLQCFESRVTTPESREVTAKSMSSQKTAHQQAANSEPLTVPKKEKRPLEPLAAIKWKTAEVHAIDLVQSEIVESALEKGVNASAGVFSKFSSNLAIAGSAGLGLGIFISIFLGPALGIAAAAIVAQAVLTAYLIGRVKGLAEICDATGRSVRELGSSQSAERQSNFLNSLLDALQKDFAATESLLGKTRRIQIGTQKSSDRLKEEIAKLKDRASWLDQRIVDHSASLETIKTTMVKTESRLRRSEYQLESIESTPIIVNARQVQKYTHFSRVISDSDTDVLCSKWNRLLGIESSIESIAYLAAHIRTIEARSAGRLATSIENAVLRVLVAKSLANHVSAVKVLEVGSLFGIGLAAIHECSIGDFESMSLIAIDPLNGYYGEKRLDPKTGQAVTASVFHRNLELAGVNSDGIELIQLLSTEPEVASKLEGRKFDLVIIDGDHTYGGVKFDFELLKNHVAPGGMVIFDDYGSHEWPEVTDYVDQCVRAMEPSYEYIGADFRSAVFRKQK